MLNKTDIIKTIELDSGLCITLSDETKHYYGGYYHVKVLAHCTVSLDRLYFDNDDQYKDACSKLGKMVRFERILEKMAVPEQEISNVRNQLVAAFNDTAVSYLSAPDFDRCLVRSEYRICCNKSLKKFVSKAM